MMSNTTKTDKKVTITMVTDDQEKENRVPLVVKDVKASSSLADIGSKEALIKVRKKTTARIPPLTLPTSSPLSPAAEEFHLPPFVSSVPTISTLASMMPTLSLTPPYSPTSPLPHSTRTTSPAATVSPP